MTSRERAPILVTGGHRTGTTWIGRLLAADPDVAYISEPLNVLHRPGVLRFKVGHWYAYICAENEAGYYSAFLELLQYRYHAWQEIRALRSAHDILRMGRDLSIFSVGRLLGQRPLLKDPFAVFSLAWFAQRLNCRIVVAVRHPAAFVSSLKRLRWSFDFADLLHQPLLMRDHLEPYRAAMESCSPTDVIAQASLLWVMIYRTLETSRQAVPDAQIVRHEDLSRDPVGHFETLYKALDLDFSSRVERQILQSSSSENPDQLPLGSVHSVNLDSRANLDAWKRRLSGNEIDRVYQIAGEAARLYYAEDDWN
jgi:hypothetical protein